MYSARQLRLAALGLVLAVAACFGTAAAARADDTYAAIAYSKSTGKYGYSYNWSSLAVAKLEALAQCDADDAQVKIWSRNFWAALAIGDDGGLGWAWGDTKDDARSDAVDECKKHTKSDHIKVILVYSGD